MTRDELRRRMRALANVSNDPRPDVWGDRMEAAYCVHVRAEGVLPFRLTKPTEEAACDEAWRVVLTCLAANAVRAQRALEMGRGFGMEGESANA